MSLRALAFLLFISSTLTHAYSRLDNAKEIRKVLDFPTLSRAQKNQLHALKIAVLDTGFGSFQEDASTLPQSTQLLKGIEKNPLTADRHGSSMAQIIWALTGMDDEGPHFYLLNGNGLSNIQQAVDFAIAEKIDILLYAQSWTHGGNFDGQGFINAEFTRAAKAGILCVVAASNYHGLVYNGPIHSTGEDSSLSYASAQSKKNQRYWEFANRLDENSVQITLAWSDFSNDPNRRTLKDLDFEVSDATGTIVAQAQLVQSAARPQQEKTSAFAREEVSLGGLKRGAYKIRIYDRSGNFSSADSLRLSLRSSQENSIEFKDASLSAEIMIPADNPQVITVGDNSPVSSVGPTLDRRRKPDVLLPVLGLQFSNGGLIPYGSSGASAAFAALLATWKAQNPALDFKGLQKILSQQPRYQGYPFLGVGF